MGFQKGNKLGGRKKKSEFIDLPRAISPWVPRIIQRLYDIVDSGEDGAAIKAANQLLDRCHGKPAETVQHVGGVTISVNIGLKSSDNNQPAQAIAIAPALIDNTSNQDDGESGD